MSGCEPKHPHKFLNHHQYNLYVYMFIYIYIRLSVMSAATSAVQAPTRPLRWGAWSIIKRGHLRSHMQSCHSRVSIARKSISLSISLHQFDWTRFYPHEVEQSFLLKALHNFKSSSLNIGFAHISARCLAVVKLQAFKHNGQPIKAFQLLYDNASIESPANRFPVSFLRPKWPAPRQQERLNYCLIV